MSRISAGSIVAADPSLTRAAASSAANAETQSCTWIPPRFSALARYVEGLKKEELLSLADEEAVALVEPSDRIRMTILLRELRADAAFGSYVPPVAVEQHPATANRLVLSAKIASRAMEKVLHDRLSILDMLQRLERDHGEMLSSVKLVDLRYNNLLGHDLQDAMRLVRACGKCEVVDLSGNRLGTDGGDPADTGVQLAQAVTELASVPGIQFVNICGSALASIDGKPVFAALEPATLAKLVFVPRQWIETNTWHRLLRQPDEEILRVIRNTHYVYYTKYE